MRWSLSGDHNLIILPEATFICLLLGGLDLFFFDGHAEYFIAWRKLATFGRIAWGEAGCHFHTLDHMPKHGITAILGWAE